MGVDSLGIPLAGLPMTISFPLMGLRLNLPSQNRKTSWTGSLEPAAVVQVLCSREGVIRRIRFLLEFFDGIDLSFAPDRFRSLTFKARPPDILPRNSLTLSRASSAFESSPGAPKSVSMRPPDLSNDLGKAA